MSSTADSRGPVRLSIQLAQGPVDHAFVRNAAILADQNPGWSGVFFAEFLAGYYEQVGLGNCGDEGEDAPGSLPRDPHDNSLLRNLYLRAADIYRHCHQLQKTANGLEQVGVSGSGYLTELVDNLRRIGQEQAVIAAGMIRNARDVRRLLIEEVSTKRPATLALRGMPKDE